MRPVIDIPGRLFYLFNLFLCIRQLDFCIGDLCFSIVKRQTGIKDYGNLIPGHGGVLDRFDAMLLSAPFVLVYMLIVM